MCIVSCVVIGNELLLLHRQVVDGKGVILLFVGSLAAAVYMHGTVVGAFMCPVVYGVCGDARHLLLSPSNTPTYLCHAFEKTYLHARYTYSTNTT